MTFTDQLGRTIELPAYPRRIISVVPSQSELLWDLGLHEELIGITKFCIHPEEMFRSKTRVGGTKQLDIEKIKQLHPDLIIANKEENEREQVEELAAHFPVWISDIQTLADAYRMMISLGELTGKREKASEIIEKIRYNFSQLKIPKGGKGKKVLYIIWKNPIMAAGKNTFIDHLLGCCGFRNILDEERYPEITPTDIQRMKPDLIFLSSEPYPFKEKHLSEFKACSPASSVMLVDGELFSWYGSRLLQAPAYFRDLLNKT